MTLCKRLEKLEAATTKPTGWPVTVLHEIMQPSASGPKLVGLMLRPSQGRDAVQIDRKHGEGEAAFRARFEADCLS